jgi:fructose-bisphosphate aldolase class 1
MTEGIAGHRARTFGPQRRIRRLFGFGKGIVAMDAAHRPISPEAPSPSRTTSGVVLAESALPLAPGLAELMHADGVMLGVRADRGVEPLYGDGHAQVSAGLDGLAERLAALRDHGVEFAVWHVPPIVAGHGRASAALAINGHAAARFALTCQHIGLVPLVRVCPPRGQHADAASTTLLSLCMHLNELDVEVDGMVLGTRLDLSEPITDGPLAALPARLGGVVLTVDTVTPAEAADAISPVRLATSRWPITFYLGREPSTAAHRTRTAPAAVAPLRRCHVPDSRRSVGR